jgi:hypothetical protein
MDPRHEMVWIVFIGNVKCVRIVGLYHVIRFFCLERWWWWQSFVRNVIIEINNVIMKIKLRERVR